MRVGGAVNPYSGHQAGMSALWHDVDYVPEKRFETPLVRKGLEDLALPSEQHQLPAGVADPFLVQEQAYTQAELQRELGIKGSTFLHGRPPSDMLSRIDATSPTLPAPASAAAELSGSRPRMHTHDDVHIQHALNQGNRHAPSEVKATQDMRKDREHVQRMNQASAVRVPKPSGASKTAADAEQAAATGGAVDPQSVADALSAAATFLPMAGGQAVMTVAQGPLPAMASTAVSVLGAVATAGQLAATGVDEALKEEPLVLRRGLRTKV